MTLSIKIISLTAIPIFLSACVHYPMDNKLYAGPKPLPDEVAQLYSYKKYPFKASETVIREKKNYIIKRIELRLPPEANLINNGEDAIITIDYYDLKGDKTTPVILVLPILGGENSESKFFAKSFANHGYAALIIHRNEQHQKEAMLKNMEITLRQTVIDVKRAIDWVETQKNLDSNNIGVFGISLGGIKSALIAALDNRIKAAVIGLAGGNLPHILIHSQERAIREKIDEMTEKNGLNPEDLYCQLKSEIQTDPIRYARYIDARKVLMVVALFDKIIPAEKGKELIAAIGMPERIYLVSGHYTSLLYIFYIKNKVLNFFNQHLR